MKRTACYLLCVATVIGVVSCAESTSPPDGSPSVSIVSGDAQLGAPGTELANPLVVQVLKANGKPANGELVNFHVVSGGGSIFAGSVISDNRGYAVDYWTLGASGTQRVEVRSVDPATGAKMVHGVFTATFTPPPVGTDAYEPNDTQVTAYYLGALNTGQSVGATGNFHNTSDTDWFSVRVNDSSDLCTIGDDLKTTFSLSVPAGVDYDLYVYDNATLLGASTAGTGQSESVEFNDPGSCGGDDTRTFQVRIVRFAGAPGAPTYTLNVQFVDQ